MFRRWSQLEEVTHREKGIWGYFGHLPRVPDAMVSAQVHGAKQLQVVHVGNMGYIKCFFIELIYFKYLQVLGVTVI